MTSLYWGAPLDTICSGLLNGLMLLIINGSFWREYTGPAKRGQWYGTCVISSWLTCTSNYENKLPLIWDALLHIWRHWNDLIEDYNQRPFEAVNHSLSPERCATGGVEPDILLTPINCSRMITLSVIRYRFSYTLGYLKRAVFLAAGFKFWYENCVNLYMFRQYMFWSCPRIC